MESNSLSNPTAQPATGRRPARLMIDCLRFVLAIQCCGIAGRYLFGSLESESHLFEYLLFERGASEKFAQIVDDVGAYLCFAAGIAFAIRLLISLALPRLAQAGPIQAGQQNWRTLNWIEICGSAFVAIWSIADALAQWARGGIYSELALGEVAVRFACPIALILLLSSQSKRKSNSALVARWILTIAISATFAVHGFKAIQLYGPFADLILLTDMQVFQFDLEQTTVETALSIIGWIDVLLAIALLFTRYKVIAIYMLVWGLITSLSRMTAFGLAAWPETAIRAANWGAALVLLAMWYRETTEVDDGDTN